MAWDPPAEPEEDTVIPQAWGKQVTDSLAAISLHKHSGAAGDGDDELTPTKIRTDDIADPAAPGAGKTVVYSNSGKWHQRAGAAGAAEEFSVVGHAHTLIVDATGVDADEHDTGISGHTVDQDQSVPLNTELTLSTVDVTVAADTILVAWGGAASLFTNYASQVYIHLYIDGVIKASTYIPVSDFTQIRHNATASFGAGAGGAKTVKVTYKVNAAGFTPDIKYGWSDCGGKSIRI